MELSINPVTPEKAAFRKLLKAFSVFAPALSKINSTNKMTIMAQVPKFIKLAKENEELLKEVINPEFLKQIEEMAR